jgi:hypothetical protein
VSDSDVATVSGVGQQKSIAKVKTTALGAVEASLTVILILELAGLVNKVQTYGMTVLGSDMQYYLDVATRLGQGQLPYRDFVFEYPPGALIPMVVADVVSMASGSGIGGYVAALFLVNIVLVAATAACLVFLARRGWAAESTSRTVITYALLCLATPVLFFRFDSFPTLLMVLSLVLFATSRVALAGVAAGAGMVVKVFPAAVIPLLALSEVLRRQWRSSLRLIGGAVVSIVATMALAMWGAGTQAFSFLGYQADRGVQLESLLASIAMLGQLFGEPAGTVANSFGAWQIDSPLIRSLPLLGPLLSLLIVGTLGTSTLIAYRNEIAVQGEVGTTTVVGYLLASMLALLLIYRVLSPQYLVWLLPLAALRPRGEQLVVLFTCILTLAVYPLLYDGLVRLSPVPMVALIVRNAMLIVLFAWLTFPAILHRIRSPRETLHPQPLDA